MSQFKISLGCLFLLFFSISCTSDDDQILLQENYLQARIGDSSLQLNDTNGKFIAKRVEQVDGGILLSIAISNSDQEGFLLQIPYYNGAKRYIIGYENMIAGRIAFSKKNPLGSWVCEYPGADGFDNYIEILKDDGIFIEGSFNFSGRNLSDASLLEISDGKFGIVSPR